MPPQPAINLSSVQRQTHLTYLKELTTLPSAAGREDAVIAWINRWLTHHPDLQSIPDRYGNLQIQHRREPTRSDPNHPELRPIYFTAHMDHPAFVVERIVAPGVVELSFRGGVMDEYFVNARIVIHDQTGGTHHAQLFGDPHAGMTPGGKPSPFKHYMAELSDSRAAESASSPINIGDVAVWDVGPAEIIDGNIHTLACDDLSALAAAVAAFESLPFSELAQPVRLLLTRAEEIGFVGAIGACREHTMPMNSRVIALENSRSFPESPIGGGPIVRVGDRMSIFNPGLTDTIAKRAEDIAGAPSTVTAAQKLAELPTWKWQRKLMAGGACEASVYCAAGYEATCVCLPLGNYHNMANLTEVQAGEFQGQPRVAREFNSVSDYEGLVDLLIACGISLPGSNQSHADRFDRLWRERNWVL